MKMRNLDLSKMENNFTEIRKWYKFISFITIKALTKIKKASKMFCLILAVGLVSCVSSLNVRFELPITITTDLFLNYWLFVYVLRPIGECTVRVDGDLAIFWKQKKKWKHKKKFIFYVVVSMKNPFWGIFGFYLLSRQLYSVVLDCNEHMRDIELLNENRGHVKNNNEHVLLKYCHIGHWTKY